MTVLVLGATGPIGRAMCNELESRGHNVFAASRTGPLQVNVLEPGSESLLTSSVGTVAYLVNPSAETLQDADRARHVEAFRRWLDAVEGSKTNCVVLVSSSAVYGTASTPITFSETSPVSAHSPYARLKLELESELAQRSKIPRRIVARVFNVFGPGCERFLVDRAREGLGPIWNTPEFARDYLHVDDIASAIRMLIESAADGYNIWNVGSGTATSNAEILSLLPPDQRDALAAAFTGAMSWSQANIGRIREMCGFEPTWTVARYLTELE